MWNCREGGGKGAWERRRRAKCKRVWARGGEGRKGVKGVRMRVGGERGQGVRVRGRKGDGEQGIGVRWKGSGGIRGLGMSGRAGKA